MFCLNKFTHQNLAHSSVCEAPFLDFVSSKTYDKRHDFDFGIVNFPFLDGDIPGVTGTYCGIYIIQLIRICLSI